MRYTWIAVALATAIRLDAGPHVWVAAAIATLAVVAAIFRRDRATWTAALFLILVAVVDLTSLWRVSAVERDFRNRATQHLNQDVKHIREQIATLEAELDAAAVRIQRRIARVPANDRARLFVILQSEVTQAGRGARIVDAGGEPVAWWGEDYRVPSD